MNRDQVISDELFERAITELARGNHWITVDRNLLFLDKQDMQFFKDSQAAHEFVAFYTTEDHDYMVFHAWSAVEILQRIPYGNMADLPLSVSGVEELFREFDWDEALYDPLRDSPEATTQPEQEQLARMEALLSAWEDLFRRNPDAALELACRYWEGRPMEQFKNDFITINRELMIEKNLEYLKNNVRNHGFGESLAPEIEARLTKGETEFTLPYQSEVNKKAVEATLYFSKSDKTELYFFNKYDVRMQGERNETMAQTFYINNGWGMTLKEAYNLLNGRSVYKELTNKEGEKYQAWVQLDFSKQDKNGNYERKQYHENYGYDLKEALSVYFVKEMGKEEEMKTLLRSLERGNLQMVTVQAPSGDVRVFLEANPQYKSVTVYDNQMNRLSADQRQELQPGKDKEQNKEKDQSKEKNKDLAPEKQEGKKTSKSKQPESKGLVEKKRTRNPGKGMGV